MSTPAWVQSGCSPDPPQRYDRLRHTLSCVHGFRSPLRGPANLTFWICLHSRPILLSKRDKVMVWPGHELEHTRTVPIHVTFGLRVRTALTLDKILHIHLRPLIRSESINTLIR